MTHIFLWAASFAAVGVCCIRSASVWVASFVDAFQTVWQLQFVTHSGRVLLERFQQQTWFKYKDRADILKYIRFNYLFWCTVKPVPIVCQTFRRHSSLIWILQNKNPFLQVVTKASLHKPSSFPQMVTAAISRNSLSCESLLYLAYKYYTSWTTSWYCIANWRPCLDLGLLCYKEMWNCVCGHVNVDCGTKFGA
jgi:hypothetical protein